MSAILDLLGCLDWLTPLLSLLDKNVETVTLNSEQIWAMDELARHGVTVKHRQIMPGNIVAFDVPVKQVDKATRLLRQMGIDLEEGPGRPRHRRDGRGH